MGFMGRWLAKIGVHVVWDCVGEPEPEACHAKAVWNVKRYQGDGPCYLVHGKTSGAIREGHTEFWEHEGHKGLPSPVGNSRLIYKGAQIYQVEQVEPGTCRRMELSDKEEKTILSQVRARQDK